MDIYFWQHYYFYHITKKKENYPEVASEDFLIVSLSNNCNDCNRKSINFLQKYRKKNQWQNLITFLQVLIRDQKVQFINCRLPPQGVITVFISVSLVSRGVTPSGSSVPSLQTQITSCQHCQQRSSS